MFLVNVTIYKTRTKTVKYLPEDLNLDQRERFYRLIHLYLKESLFWNSSKRLIFSSEKRPAYSKYSRSHSNRTCTFSKLGLFQ